MRALTCALIVLATSPARANSPKLEEARAAIEAVHYDVASELLDAALANGGNSPAALTEIYQLAATTAVVLEQPERAIRFFRIWLALDRNASEPTNTAEKFRTPFVAAQAYVREHGALALRIGKRSDKEIEIVIDSDPLRLVASASLDTDAPSARLAPGTNRHIILPVPRGHNMVRVYVLDRFGNHVAERAFATFSELPSDWIQVQRTPFLRSWQLWSIFSAVLVGGGIGFGLEADKAQRHLEEIPGSQGMFFYTDATNTVARRDRDGWIANGLFVGAGACAVTALVMYLVKPPKRWVFSPSSEGSPGITATRSF